MTPDPTEGYSHFLENFCAILVWHSSEVSIAAKHESTHLYLQHSGAKAGGLS